MAPLNEEVPVRKTRVRAVLLLALTFVAGAIAGAATDRFALVRQHRMVPRGGLHFTADRIASRLDRELNLTDAQRAQVDRILKERGAAIDAAWSRVQPEVRAEVERRNTEIEAILTPEQREKFAEMRARWKQHARRLSGHGH
jgi:Spy/CpxP family protein refolding chaperone